MRANYSPNLGQFPGGNLSYSLPLLVGFDLVEVDHDRRLTAPSNLRPCPLGSRHVEFSCNLE